MQVILISLLIALWWIGLWGLIETIIHQYIKISPIFVYISLIIGVLIIVYFNPTLLEHFA